MATWLQKAAGAIGNTLNRPINTLSGRLPEFGISERLTSYANKMNPINPPSAKASDVGGSSYYGSQSIPNQSVLGASTYRAPTNPITGGSQGGAGAQSGFNQGISNMQSQQDQGLDFIEQDYANALGMLAGQEQGLQSQAGTAQGQIESEAGQVRTQLGQEQATRQQGVQEQLQTSEREGQSSMQQARDLFRQTQQQNIAQLSALGISSSSVAEALAERLGVETARRIAGVTGSLQEVRQNATKEIARVKDYYQSRLTDVQNQVAVQKSQIQNALMSGLNQINSARQQAATDKARSRAELINNVQNSIFQLTQQQQQFENSLKQWAAQKSAALTPIVTDPNFINTLSQATSNFNQQFAPSGFQYAPQVETDPYGRVKGNINYSLQKKPDEDLLAPPKFQ